MNIAEPVFMAFVIFSSPDECKKFSEYYNLERLFQPQCVEMGGEADYRRTIPNIKPRPRPEQGAVNWKLGQKSATVTSKKRLLWSNHLPMITLMQRRQIF
jgi:hypothetical protein